MVIYKTTNLINGKFYIGQDTNNNPRYFGSGVKIKLAIKKYGKENFTKEILQYCYNQEELNEREKYWIKQTNAIEIGYNLAEGGFGCSNMSDEIKKKISNAKKGVKLNISEETREKKRNYLRNRIVSDETRQKLREANIGKTLSAEHKEKLRQAHLGTKLTDEHKRKIGLKSKGRIMSESAKTKMSKAHTGKKLSAKTKLKISNVQKGKKLSSEQKEKISKSLIGNTRRRGKPQSEEAKKKIAEASRNRSHSEETRKKISKIQNDVKKKVCQIDPKTKEIIKIYDSINQASKALNISRHNLSTLVNGNSYRKTVGGYEWKFFNN